MKQHKELIAMNSLMRTAGPDREGDAAQQTRTVAAAAAASRGTDDSWVGRMVMVIVSSVKSEAVLLPRKGAPLRDSAEETGCDPEKPG